MIVKHSNPCGASVNNNKVDSLKKHACDPISAFGGIVSCNFKVNTKVANELNKFLEVIIGNGFEKNAIKILKRKKNLRIIDSSRIKLANKNNLTNNFNSFLIQSPDNKFLKKTTLK